MVSDILMFLLALRGCLIYENVSRDVIDRHLMSYHVLCKASNLLQAKLSKFLQPPTVRYKDNWARKSFCRLNSQVMDPAAYAIHLLLELT